LGTAENKDPEKGVGIMNGPREKFGQLILRRVTKIVTTRCQIVRLNCTKFDFSWGSAPDPVGEFTALPKTPWLDLRGLLLRGGRRH